MIADMSGTVSSVYIGSFVLAFAAVPALVSFALVATLGQPTIVGLRRLSFRQKAYEDAPQSHAVKTGTPTMGGVLFILSLVVLAFVSAILAVQFVGNIPADPAFKADYSGEIYSLIGLGVACGLIGFTDDLMGVLLGRNRGLGAREKFALTAIMAGIFLYSLSLMRPELPVSFLAFGSLSFAVPVWVWYAVSFLVILSTTHAVNLTDGLDGLAAGTIVPPLLLLSFIGARTGDVNAVLVDVVTIGAVLGFFIYNRHPARLFMGDTGSLLLGGVLAGSAIVLGQQLLLLLIGGVFAAEALSVIIQVTYFKRTGKRIFKMSPLHHHFELIGWPETKVTARFWLASLILSLLGLATTFAPRAAL